MPFTHRTLKYGSIFIHLSYKQMLGTFKTSLIFSLKLSIMRSLNILSPNTMKSWEFFGITFCIRVFSLKVGILIEIMSTWNFPQPKMVHFPITTESRTKIVNVLST